MPNATVAFDPSIDATGYAALWDDGAHGTILEAGLIKTRPSDGASRQERLDDLIQQTAAVLKRHADTSAARTAVVEFPFSRARPGGHATRSILSLPTMGMAVGAVYATARAHGYPTVLTPGSDEWPGNTVPPTRGDDHKTARVRYVESLYRLREGELGPKTTAGNVADAILLARWGIWTTRTDTPR